MTGAVTGVRAVSYTRLASVDRRGRNLARRQRFLAEAVSRRPGWALLAGYADVGLAGRVDRPGLARLLADAAAGYFDVVVVDDLDRLDTDPARLHAVVGELRRAGVGVWPLVSVARRRRAAGWLAVAVTEMLAD